MHIADLGKASVLARRLGALDAFLAGADQLSDDFLAHVKLGSYEGDVRLGDIRPALEAERARLAAELDRLGVSLDAPEPAPAAAAPTPAEDDEEE